MPEFLTISQSDAQSLICPIMTRGQGPTQFILCQADHCMAFTPTHGHDFYCALMPVPLDPGEK